MFNKVKYKPLITFNNKFLLFIVSLILCSINISAQDKIHFINGIIIEAKIQVVDANEIAYKKFNNLNGPTYTIKKNDVKMIVYENGEKENFIKETITRQNKLQYLTSKPSDINSNHDIIVTLNSDEINCTIDIANINTISYHIKRSGADPKGTITTAEVLKYFRRNQWYNVDGTITDSSTPREKARDLIITDNINQAISAYSSLITVDSLNSLLLAEDAYALALGGVYEAALYRLDRCWSLDIKSSDVNFFTAQVYALMGYNDLANEFWKESKNNKAPQWIASKSNTLLTKYKRSLLTQKAPTREVLITKFKIANKLAAQNSYFQSLALFQELTYFYPNEYLPYIGYSTTLEKTGAYTKSAQCIEKAISLIGNNPEEKAKKQILEQRLKTITQKANHIPTNALPGFDQAQIQNINRPQAMIYAGGMVAPSVTSLNFRMGYFVSGSSNASFDLGFANRNDLSYTNMGLSIYTRSKAFVAGTGLIINSVEGTSTAYFKLSVGISIMNKKQTSSFDTFLDVNQGFKKGSINTYGLSVGTSLYFGKRK